MARRSHAAQRPSWPCSAADLARYLEYHGFRLVRRNNCHLKYRNAQGRAVVVPDHGRLAKGTYYNALRQAGL